MYNTTDICLLAEWFAQMSQIKPGPQWTLFLLHLHLLALYAVLQPHPFLIRANPFHTDDMCSSLSQSIVKMSSSNCRLCSSSDWWVMIFCVHHTMYPQCIVIVSNAITEPPQREPSPLHALSYSILSPWWHLTTCHDPGVKNWRSLWRRSWTTKDHGLVSSKVGAMN